LTVAEEEEGVVSAQERPERWSLMKVFEMLVAEEAFYQ
jgi:hypothetical protein